MKSSTHLLRKIIIPLAFLILVGFALNFGLRKTITLDVNGDSRHITTYSLTVGNLLRSQQIPISLSDSLSPAQDTWLKNGETITLLRAVPIQILADGAIKSIFSSERLPSSLLTQAGIQLQPGDLLLSNVQPIEPDHPFPANIKSISLQVIQAISFTLSVNGEQHIITSTATTLGAALWSAGYPLFVADQLTPPADTPLVEGLAATLTNSHQVSIHTQFGDLTVRTAAKTVGEALEAAHLSPQGLDYSVPALDNPIPSNGKIRLIRVTEQVLLEQTSLPFETQYQPVSDLELDSQSILQAGEYGLSAQRVRVRYEDGQEASRRVESEWVARQPQPRIIGYGTQVVMHTTTVDGVQIHYWRALNMYATSYHPSEVGDTTASGLPLKKGVAAVDTSIIPFYTQMYVPGYGEVIAADIGGAVTGRWIDLGYSDNDYVPWHSWVTVYFLWPPPDNIVWIVP
ncbi:MAG: ubiquitin-like domain-containing protein [Anaerolineales bacterium]